MVFASIVTARRGGGTELGLQRIRPGFLLFVLVVFGLFVRFGLDLSGPMVTLCCLAAGL